MTILVAGTVELPAETREQALAEAAPLMVETLTQPGCLHYVWSADPSSDTRVYVYEEWNSTEEFASHLAGEYYSRMFGLMGKYGVSNAVVNKYRIDLTEPVYDPEGRPRADFFSG
jgi:quinol monooxygenase YgiN